MNAQDQYEAPVTPAKWQGDEKRFAIRLKQALDALFMRLGKVERRLKELEQRGENP